MLVLSRKLNEKIIIDDQIEVTVVGIENGKVQLGIEAPKEIEIMRKELLEDVKEENQKAVKNKKLLDQLNNIKFNL
ncbi:carbon storage regulator CsrA [Halanaerobium saccharolyticum]|uniref:Translational regulator CsrA n=1 Tax=Halanaerobium saccharolyticum TaxID=43595 RepID=A0A4R7YL47_9FIRM|nr:carbon storage regulator CsrA [Halanaerobium saccharolyticum]RAK04924.1 carbon storage regulator CsrA [Halanaerobium saccharolyticum]TDV98296.1 carbon storage regulator CsrA [Halanaerobium saccharolyticum]TDX51234.1 carbon storage regulator CsrA [Halanaerobium saccharolyticum]